MNAARVLALVVLFAIAGVLEDDPTELHQQNPTITTTAGENHR